MKYRLIKEFPYSPKLNTIVCTDSQVANSEGYYFMSAEVINQFIGEFYEEIEEDYRFVVRLNEGAFVSAWKVIEYKKQPEDYNDKKDSDNIKFFKTKEGAENFILINKPCLSIKELFELSNEEDWCVKIRRATELKELVKSKL